MHSHLRRQSSFEPFTAHATYQTTASPSLPPAKKQKMSLTQTYYVASTARTKLGREAGRADHNLRLLVGHANLLDTLMVDLADAEREQEAWFNQSVQKASRPQEPQHAQWINSIAEDEADDSDSDMESDSGSDIYDEDTEMFNIPIKKIRSPPVEFSSSIEAIEDDAEFDDEYDDALTLTRVPSQHSPPELTLDSDSESDDDSMPSSPAQPAFELSEKERQTIATTDFYDMKTQQHQQQQQPIEELLARQHQQPMVAAC